jgi:hypothetical protein
LLCNDGEFFILALSRSSARLYIGSRFSIREVEAEGIQKAINDLQEQDTPQKQLQFHTGTPARPSKRPAMYHGHGAGKDTNKDSILKFFRIVNACVHEALKNNKSPLVLIGVEYLLPIYKEVNTYPHLIQKWLTGNPESLSEEELHRQAWELVKPQLTKIQLDKISLYEETAGTEKTSNDIKEIVPAACFGRIDTLFVAAGLQQWGGFDRENSYVTLYHDAMSGSEDLLDFAAIQTILHGGRVYVVDPDEVPDSGLAAAVFRY